MDPQIDRMLNIGDFLEENQVSLSPALDLGFDTDLASYNFHLPDLDDFPSTTTTQSLDKRADHQEMSGSDNGSSKSKQSPWHESDSGMSDAMSFAESPLGGTLEEMSLRQDYVLPDFLDAQEHNNLVDANSLTAAFLEGLENDVPLAAAFSPSNHQETVNVSAEDDTSALNRSKRPVRKCVAERKWDILDVECTDSEDETKIDEVGKARQQHEVEDLNYFNGQKFASRSNIKILKVVKPTNSGNDADEIIKALDERSKKNARQAKINREKKKAYINGLESDIEKLQKENGSLISENKEMREEMTKLEDEVSYLKSVLANASALSGLLKNLNKVTEVKLSATITGRKRGAEDDHNYNLIESKPEKRARVVRENLKKAGVCLHVSEGEACLEFCAHCASLASKTHGRKGNKL